MELRDSITGILLSKQNYRERDLLLRIYTDKFGIKTFFIKNGNRKKFNYPELLMLHGKIYADVVINDQGFSFIQSINDFDIFNNIRLDITKSAYATYLYELILKSFLDGQSNYMWYKLLDQSLNLIEGGFDPQIITNIVEIKDLKNLGVAPILDKSAFSLKPLEKVFDYSPKYHGFINKSEFEADQNRLFLSNKTARLFALISEVNLDSINSINVSDTVKLQLQKAIDGIFEDTTGLRFKAKNYIKQLNKMNKVLKRNSVDNNNSK